MAEGQLGLIPLQIRSITPALALVFKAKVLQMCCLALSGTRKLLDNIVVCRLVFILER